MSDPVDGKLYEFPAYRWFPDETDGSLFCDIAAPGWNELYVIIKPYKMTAYKCPYKYSKNHSARKVRRNTVFFVSQELSSFRSASTTVYRHKQPFS